MFVHFCKTGSLRERRSKNLDFTQGHFGRGVKRVWDSLWNSRIYANTAFLYFYVDLATNC